MFKQPEYHSPLVEETVTVPYRSDFGIAADASLQLMLAFLTLTTGLKRESKLITSTVKDSAEVSQQPILQCDFESGW